MTAPADMFDEVEPYESFDGLEFADEARSPFMPGRRVFAPGGLASATLHTPKGPAKLSLPSPVPTLAQYRSLEQAVNSLTQRLNATNSQLLQVRRELAVRQRDQGGAGSMGTMLSILMQKKLRDDLEGHTHEGSSAPAKLPAGSGSKLDSLLPILFLQPGILGGATASRSAAGGQDALSPLTLMLLLD